jgi:outer membrane protein OmpA-like peptidoglycan-associated protein
MSRSVSRPLGRISILVVANLLTFGGTAVWAAPISTPSPEVIIVGGPVVTAPVLDVKALVLDVFVVSANIEGDSTEAETTGRVQLTLGADVLFAFGKADLTPAANQRLAQIADRIRQQAKGIVRIDGHTDSIGDPASNQRLSQQRAEAVRVALAPLAESSVTFQVTGHGETRPVADNATPDGKDNPAGRAKNRRVEIRFDK